MKKRLIATTAALFAAAMLWSGAHSSATAGNGNDWERGSHLRHQAIGGNDWELISNDRFRGNDWEFTGIDSEFTGNDWELTRSSSARGNDWE